MTTTHIITDRSDFSAAASAILCILEMNDSPSHLETICNLIATNSDSFSAEEFRYIIQECEEYGIDYDDILDAFSDNTQFDTDDL